MPHQLLRFRLNMAKSSRVSPKSGLASSSPNSPAASNGSAASSAPDSRPRSNGWPDISSRLSVLQERKGPHVAKVAAAVLVRYLDELLSHVG